MDRFLDLTHIAAYAFAAINILLAMYFHYRYTVGPSSTKNFRNAQFHWVASTAFAILAVNTDRSMSIPVALALTIAIALALTVPLIYLRKIRATRYPTFFEQINADDIIDRARNGHTHD
jgi:Flp pilus assembly protein TadB